MFDANGQTYAESFPLFNEALNSPASEVWKAALDALVTLSGPTAKALLETAEAELPIDRRAWVREALKQIS
jgi:hypothetical protein